MEGAICLSGSSKPSDSRGSERNISYQPVGPMGSVLTDAVLKELKEQSANGCLLCSLEAWDGEELD